METQELVKKYGINLKKLEEEQLKLAESLEFNKGVDWQDVAFIGGVESFMIKNKIVSVIIVCNKEFEIIDQSYFTDSLRFPYIHGFKSYREIPSVLGAYKKLQEKPGLLLIKGEGINHERLGIASHLALALDLPVIGVSDDLYEGNEIKNNAVFMGKPRFLIINLTINNR